MNSSVILPRAFVETIRGPSSAPPPARPCVAPPADDRLELLRAWLLDGYGVRLRHCGRHLVATAALTDTEAWDAVALDLDAAAGTGSSRRVAQALSVGDLDGAVGAAAAIEDESAEAWLSGQRAFAARKGGAR